MAEPTKAAPIKPEGTNKVVKVDQKGVPIVIPAVYKQMGATSGYNPKAPEDLRLYMTGPTGEGKSTFVSSIPDSLILDFEDGARAVAGGQAARVKVQNWDHLEQIAKQLEKDGHAGKKPFRRITFDTSDEWVTMIESQLNKEKGVEDVTDFGSQGHGWALLRNRCWSLVRRLENAGYTWCIVGHLTQRNITDPITRKDITVTRPLVFGSLSKQMERNCDMYGNTYSLTAKKQKTKVITVQGRPQTVPIPNSYTTENTYYLKIMAKVRGIPLLDEKIELQSTNGWGVFKDLYNASVKATQAKLL